MKSRPAVNPSAYLEDVCERLQSEYRANKRVMGFEEYLELFLAHPRQQARGAAQYLLDCFEYYGSSERTTPLGDVRRWTLFDAPWDDGRDCVIGQEAVQHSVYRILRNFARQGKINKLILLHGPNGSSKSSLIACIARALEAYSHTEAGALYCFDWVFPTRGIQKSRLGFGSSSVGEEPSTYADLEPEDVAAAIPSDLRDHPMLLLPISERAGLLSKAGVDDPEYRIPESLLHGELCPRNQHIAELLYTGNQGDLRSVLRHVRIRRFYLSRRFRRGIVTVEPQLHVDASVRQLTGDRSLTTLPLLLQSTTLYEAHGDLVDSHRGMIEYTDLLKRPLDSFKYLLSTSEKSTVALSNQILHLDLIFFASSNESHLGAFKEYTDWPSFKGRFELVRVAYLRDYLSEQRIYEAQVSEAINEHIAPHTNLIAALWAVLTRLRKPRPDNYPKELRGTIASLSPLQKADLYATGRTPPGLAIEKARLLRTHVEKLGTEDRGDGVYEGQTGASPREMKLVLLNAAQRPEFSCVSPLSVLAEIEDLITQKSVYAFLQSEPEGQYGDYTAFIEVARTRWLELADEDLTRAMGLVGREQYDDLFRRYLIHVGHAGRGEKMLNPITGAFDEPDTDFMAEMEKHFDIDKQPEEFRGNLLGRIGAASQKGPVSQEDYRQLFPNLFDKLEGAYYAKQRDQVRKIAADLLTHLAGGGDRLAVADRTRAVETLDHLVANLGYQPSSIREMVSTLVSERYAD